MKMLVHHWTLFKCSLVTWSPYHAYQWTLLFLHVKVLHPVALASSTAVALDIILNKRKCKEFRAHECLYLKDTTTSTVQVEKKLLLLTLQMLKLHGVTTITKDGDLVLSSTYWMWWMRFIWFEVEEGLGALWKWMLILDFWWMLMLKSGVNC